MLVEAKSTQLKDAILAFNYELPKINQKETANTVYNGLSLKYESFEGTDEEKIIFNYYLALTALHAGRFQDAGIHLKAIKAPFDYTTARVRVGTQQYKLLPLPVDSMAAVLSFTALDNLEDYQLNLFDWSKFTQYGHLNSDAGARLIRVLYHAAPRYRKSYGEYASFFRMPGEGRIELRTTPIVLQDLIALIRFHAMNYPNDAIKYLFESIADPKHRHDVIFTVIYSMSLLKQGDDFKHWVLAMAALIPKEKDTPKFDKDWHAPILALSALFEPKYQYYLGMAIEHGHSSLPGVNAWLSFRVYPADYVYLLCYHQADLGKRQPHVMLYDIIQRHHLITDLPSRPEIALNEEKATPHEVAMTLWKHANDASIPAVQLLFANHFASRMFYRETEYNPTNAKIYAELVLGNEAADEEQKKAAQAIIDSFAAAPSTTETYFSSWVPDRQTPGRMLKKLGATFGTDDSDDEADADARSGKSPAPL